MSIDLKEWRSANQTISHFNSCLTKSGLESHLKTRVSRQGDFKSDYLELNYDVGSVNNPVSFGLRLDFETVFSNRHSLGKNLLSASLSERRVLDLLLANPIGGCIYAGTSDEQLLYVQFNSEGKIFEVRSDDCGKHFYERAGVIETAPVVKAIDYAFSLYNYKYLQK